jgi:hypothetical protein
MEKFMKNINMISDNKKNLEELAEYYKTQNNCKDIILTPLANGTYKLLVIFDDTKG